MKGRMTGRGMVLALLLLFALSGALSASGGEEKFDVPRSGFLAGTYVNLREKPSTEGKIVGQLPSKDEAGELLVTAAFDGGEEFPWYRVSSAKFGEGWIYGKFLRLGEAAQAIHPIDKEINRCVDLYFPAEGKCDFYAYIIDPDPKGTNVRSAPGGAVIAVLPHRPENSDIITVKVTGHKKGWLSVILHDGKKGWIFGRMLGVSLRNYAPDSVTSLRCRPDEDAPSSGDIFRDDEVALLGGEGEWALVEYTLPDGGVITGWLDPMKQCANPYSTCP
ncbi:hypothetical protein MASR2M79_03460 [Aminivibrio sp.]